jgi:hypothetical protein
MVWWWILDRVALVRGDWVELWCYLLCAATKTLETAPGRHSEVKGGREKIPS